MRINETLHSQLESLKSHSMEHLVGPPLLPYSSTKICIILAGSPGVAWAFTTSQPLLAPPRLPLLPTPPVPHRSIPTIWTPSQPVPTSPRPSTRRSTPHNFNPSVICPGSSSTYLQSFNCVSRKLCECIETDRDNPLCRYRLISSLFYIAGFLQVLQQLWCNQYLIKGPAAGLHRGNMFVCFDELIMIIRDQ